MHAITWSWNLSLEGMQLQCYSIGLSSCPKLAKIDTCMYRLCKKGILLSPAKSTNNSFCSFKDAWANFDPSSTGVGLSIASYGTYLYCYLPNCNYAQHAGEQNPLLTTYEPSKQLRYNFFSKTDAKSICLPAVKNWPHVLIVTDHRISPTTWSTTNSRCTWICL